MPVSDSAISPAVRRQLEIRAAERGVPVDVLVVEILRAAVAQRATRCAVSVTSSEVSVTSRRAAQ